MRAAQTPDTKIAWRNLIRKQEYGFIPGEGVVAASAVPAAELKRTGVWHACPEGNDGTAPFRWLNVSWNDDGSYRWALMRHAPVPGTRTPASTELATGDEATLAAAKQAARNALAQNPREQVTQP